MNRLSIYKQLTLWILGISWHNTVRNECTPDSNCCSRSHTSFWKRIKFAMTYPYHSYKYNKACKEN